ncbi:MAG: EamA family transporter [Verrucomicrobiota bacterium]|nr:EamA family transporter [Verrucomicrobiota bacterium]
MTKIIIILLIALVFEAVGVVFLSGGLKEIGELKQVNVSAIAQLIKRGATNGKILLGILFEAIFFGALLYLLSQRDVSLIWPLTSLGFVITAVAAKIFLHEQVSPVRWIGVGLIVLGAAFVSYGEKSKDQKSSERPALNGKN